SPDGKRYAYVATRKDKDFLVLDGVESGPYVAVNETSFSSDSKHFICAVRHMPDGPDSVLKDGKELDALDGWAHSLCFAPGGRSWAVGVHYPESSGKKPIVRAR